MLHSPESESRDAPCTSVLIAEDDCVCRTILHTWLQAWGYQVVIAEDGLKAWDILQQEQAPPLLILDWVMPGLDGTELCRRVRERQYAGYHYILLVTANNAKQEVVRGLEAGADDYLTKPFDMDELRARLKVGERILALHQQLRFQATHDALTGAWNRDASLELLHRELNRAMRSQTGTGLLMLDVDHFKNINDTHGHLVGDGVLKEVVRRITRTVRTYDVVGRYGGEEFVIVLPGCPGDQVRETSERIRAVVAGEPILADGRRISATVSIGASVALPARIPVKTLLAMADAALYRAKSAGRNCVMVSDALSVAH